VEGRGRGRGGEGREKVLVLQPVRVVEREMVGGCCCADTLQYDT
jgi:hypothetical protein